MRFSSGSASYIYMCIYIYIYICVYLHIYKYVARSPHPSSTARSLGRNSVEHAMYAIFFRLGIRRSACDAAAPSYI